MVLHANSLVYLCGAFFLLKFKICWNEGDTLEHRDAGIADWMVVIFWGKVVLRSLTSSTQLFCNLYLQA